MNDSIQAFYRGGPGIDGDRVDTVVRAPVGVGDTADEVVAVSSLNNDAIPCLVAAIEADPTKEPPGGRQALTIADRCRSDNTGAALFADEAQRQNDGTLADEQVACLTNGYRQLDTDDLEKMLAGAIGPANADTTTITKVETICTDCNVEP